LASLRAVALSLDGVHDALAAQCRSSCARYPAGGNGRNHDDLDDHLDWCLAAHDLIVAAGYSLPQIR